MRGRYTRRTLFSLAAAIPAAAAAHRARAASPPAPPLASELVDEGEAFREGSFDHVRLVAGPRGALVLRAGAAGGAFVSAPRVLPRGTTHAGLHWLTDGTGEQPGVFLRLAKQGGFWSPWEPVAVERSAEAPGRETFGALRDTRGFDLAQYRFEFSKAPAAGVPRAAITAIAVPRGPSAATASAIAATSEGAAHITLPSVIREPGVTLIARPGFAVGPVTGAELPIVSREQWGADDSYRFTESGIERWHEMFVLPRKLVVHHTASRNGYGPGEASADAQAINYYHATIHGWGDIGYNALIAQYGAIYDGRHGRGGDPGDPLALPSRLNPDLSAGHTKWHNYGSAGVALIGDSEAPGWLMGEPSGPMWDALVAYATFVCREGNIRPVDASGDGPWRADFLQSDDRWSLDAASIDGHIAFEATYCPGEPVLAMLPDLRQAVFEGLTGTSRTGVTITSATPAEREVRVGTPLSAAWVPEAPEPGWTVAGCEYRWEAWFKPQDGDDLDYLAGFSNELQPLARWLPAPPSITTANIIPRAPGHYSLHVRPTVRKGNVLRAGAFAAAHTWLVTE